MNGKLNGVTAAQTPSGTRTENASTPVATCSVSSPLSSSPPAHATSRVSSPRISSPAASARILPGSSPSTAMNRSLSASISSPQRRSTWTRRLTGHAPQDARRVTGDTDGGVHDLGVAERDVADDRAGRRITELEPAVRRAGQLAADPVSDVHHASTVT